jgi:hypothetical protein
MDNNKILNIFTVHWKVLCWGTPQVLLENSQPFTTPFSRTRTTSYSFQISLCFIILYIYIYIYIYIYVYIYMITSKLRKNEWVNTSSLLQYDRTLLCMHPCRKSECGIEQKISQHPRLLETQVAVICFHMTFLSLREVITLYRDFLYFFNSFWELSFLTIGCTLKQIIQFST